MSKQGSLQFTFQDFSPNATQKYNYILQQYSTNVSTPTIKNMTKAGGVNDGLPGSRDYAYYPKGHSIGYGF